jgi:Protein of unknown function (DUF3712)
MTSVPELILISVQFNLPMVSVNSYVSTGNNADFVLSFLNQPLNASDIIQFVHFFTQLVTTTSVPVALKGTTDVLAKTCIGDVPISGIPFNVSSTLTGLNSFGETLSLSNFIITDAVSTGGSQYILWTLDITVENPSIIFLKTVGISLPTFFEGVEVNTLHKSYTGLLT